MGYLVFDIEAVLDPTVRWEPKPDAKDPFPPPPCWEPVCIGALALTDDLMPVKLDCLPGTTEVELLSAFSNAMGKAPTLVGYNSRGYDCPVLVARSLRHLVPAAWAYGKDFRYRYSDRGHVDLQDELTDYGASRPTSLDTWASLIGAPGKGRTKGEDVAGMVAAGRLDEVKAYCLRDVVTTGLLFVRWLHCRGASLRRTELRQVEEAIRAFGAGRMAA